MVYLSQRTDEEKIVDFVNESNAIEGILRDANSGEIEATMSFIGLDVVTLDDVCALVGELAGAKLRDEAGMDVQVGKYQPNPGGPQIRDRLHNILESVRDGVWTPFYIHTRYESLHPFMDGNGRSGRAIWAWQMLNQNVKPGLDLGFLHAFYYQTLEQ